MAIYRKGRFRPKPRQGKKAKELRWLTTCLASKPTEDSAPKYADWEACASVFVAIDILTHIDGIRHSGLEGEPEETARGLLVLVACALHNLHKTGTADPNTDPSTIEEPAENLSFSEIQKRSLHTRLFSVLCEIVTDKDALLNFGGMILPFGGMTLFLTFSSTADETIRTSLPEKIKLALRSHKAMFYNGGLLFTVTSSVAAPPAFNFQIALLTPLCLEHADQVPTPTERPRQISDVIAHIYRAAGPRLLAAPSPLLREGGPQ